MDAAIIGKHITHCQSHIKEALQLLDMGVHENIGEDCALLCADTQIMFAIFDLQDARSKMKARMEELNV